MVLMVEVVVKAMILMLILMMVVVGMMMFLIVILVGGMEMILEVVVVVVMMLTLELGMRIWVMVLGRDYDVSGDCDGCGLLFWAEMMIVLAIVMVVKGYGYDGGGSG